jgi:hypothetical protein
MALEPHVLPAADLASAWLAATEWTASTDNKNRGLVITIPADDTGTVARNAAFEARLTAIINALNDASSPKKPRMVPFVDNASTIFPENIWRARSSEGRERFYQRYLALLPRIKKLSKKNVYGVYFERMIAYAAQREGKPECFNQLEFVIKLLNKRKAFRQSALQISVFHPAFDHTGQAQRGFPCLQQVSFTYSAKRTLHLNAYYPTQYLFERGYGNYLGLCHLGRFIAEETKYRFSGMTCFVGAPCNKLGDRAVRDHCTALRTAMDTDPTNAPSGGAGA